jgi:transposase
LVESADAEDEVFYVDEADIDLNPRIGTTYMRLGEQLVVLTPGKNVKRYVAGALNARSGKVVHVVAERKNSELFLALVDALRRAYRRARRIHLVLDNFIIHKSKRTLRHLARLGGRIVLHFLPPYSPESNVIERLWKQLHDHVTRNHAHRAIECLREVDVREAMVGEQLGGARATSFPVVDEPFAISMRVARSRGGDRSTRTKVGASWADLSHAVAGRRVATLGLGREANHLRALRRQGGAVRGGGRPRDGIRCALHRRGDRDGFAAERVERAALAFLTYVKDHPDGFAVLAHGAPVASATGGMRTPSSAW